MAVPVSVSFQAGTSIQRYQSSQGYQSRGINPGVAIRDGLMTLIEKGDHSIGVNSSAVIIPEFAQRWNKRKLRTWVSLHTACLTVFKVRLVGLLVEDSMAKPEAGSEGEREEVMNSKEWMPDRCQPSNRERG